MKRKMLKRMLSVVLCFAIIMVVGVIPNNNITNTAKASVPQTTNSNIEIWDGNVADSFAGGTGTKELPFLISNASEFAYMAKIIDEGKNLTSYYKLISDIYLNDVSNFDDWENHAPRNNWTPIGCWLNSSDLKLSFDGNNHKIIGMYVNGETNNDLSDNRKQFLGLFGILKGAKLYNIKIEKSIVIGHEVNGLSCYAGGIAGEFTTHYGYNDGVINNCHFDGKIISSVSGGLVGYLNIVNGSMKIEQCSSTGSIESKKPTRTEARAGGIIGLLDNSGNNIKFSKCHNLSQVKGDGISGGIIGELDFDSKTYDKEMTISELYNSGNITGIKSAGGLIGQSHVEASATDVYLKINDSYNIGRVSGEGIMGGFCGIVENEIYYSGITTAETDYNRCYDFDVDKLDLTERPLVGKKTDCKLQACYSCNRKESYCLASEEFSQKGNFNGFDFDNVWIMNNKLGRPILRENLEDENSIGNETNEYIKSLYPQNGATDVKISNSDNIQLEIKFNYEIELGKGKVYICDYNTDKVYRTIYTKGMNDEYNFGDIRSKDVNTLNIEIFNCLNNYNKAFGSQLEQSVSLIPYNTKLYVKIDPGVVKFKNISQKEFSIDNKNIWSFTTVWGLTGDVELLQFGNLTDKFSAHYDVSGSIEDLLLYYLMKKGGLKDAYAKIEKLIKEDTWEGSCYGMSAVTALAYSHAIDLSKWPVANNRKPANNCADIAIPINNISEFGSRDLINYYQLLQFLDAKFRICASKGILSTENWKNTIDDIVLQAKNIQLTKKPIIVYFTLSAANLDKEKNENGGHACLITGYNNIDGIDILELYDSSHSPNMYSTISIDNSYNVTYKGAFLSYGKNNNLIRENKVSQIGYTNLDLFSTYNIDNMASSYLPDSSKKLIMKQEGGYDYLAPNSVSVLNSTGHTILYCSGTSDFIVTNKEGKNLKIVNGELEATISVYSVIPIGEGKNFEYRIETDTSEIFKYESDDDNASLTVYQDNFYIDVSTKNKVNSITIHPGVSAFVDCEGMTTYSTHFSPSECDNEMLSISGVSNNNLDIVYDDGKVALESDNLEDARVKYYNNNIVKDIKFEESDTKILVDFADRLNSDFIFSNCTHLFNDYNYNNPVSGSAVVIYGNGVKQKINGEYINNKQFVAYTDILASYNYATNSKGIVKPSTGKVIAGITKSDIKPVVTKNKIVDKEATKIAKARIRNGQVTVTATGKEKGLVYLWIIDTGSKGVSECCPINVQIAPRKLEVQDASGNKLKSLQINNGESIDVNVAGIVSGNTKTDDCTYTAMAAPGSQNYITVTPVSGTTSQFKITGTGLKNNKNTKASIIFICNENNKKVKLNVIIKK